MSHPPDRHRQRERHWPAVLRILGELPSPQLKQALLLGHDLALQYADDGQSQRLLSRRWDFPLFDLAGWLLDDWGIEDTPERVSFEGQLFVATTFSFLAAEIRLRRLDPHSFFDAGCEPLERELSRLAGQRWTSLFDEASPFWEHHRQAHESAFSTEPPADSSTATGHWALASLPAVASALWAGKRAAIPALSRFVELGRQVLQIVDQLSTCRRDLANGRITQPIVRALDALGVADRSAVRIETALAALLFTGKLDSVLQENRARIAEARRIAVGLELTTLQAWCDEIDTLMGQVGGLFGLKREAPAEPPSPMPGFFVPAPAVLDNVLKKAEACLLEDPSFREAWDVLQHVYIGTQRLVGRTFGPSLIIDLLAAQGHRLQASVDELLENLQAQRFRYWDHAHLLVPDIDTLALAIRLIPHSSDPGRQRAALQAPLRWMRESQLPSGRIPVWLRNHDLPPPLSEAAVLYGAQCATVESNLMLSLIGDDWPGHRELVEACARHWCGRWLDIGLGACEHYPPLYSLWAGTELVAQLQARSVDQALQRQLRDVAAALSERLRREARRADLGPQDAAFLMLASLRSQAVPFDAEWVTTIFKHQRPDGFWEGEPIYVVPSARNLSTQWFRSRSITTAFIYHALKHHQAARQARTCGEGR